MSAFAHGKFRGKRLVIFGCGYLGTEVAARAHADGVLVTALTRNEAKAIALRATGIEAVVGDLATSAWHEQIQPEADLVLNCVSSGGGGVEGYRHSYVAGMASLLAWAARGRGVGTLVYTSSTSVYPQNGGIEVCEIDPTGGEERAHLLLEAENQLHTARRAAQRWFILRLAGIYGPGRHHLLAQVRTGEVSGHGEHRLNLAHRDDCVSAIEACFAAPPMVADEILNVADDAPAPKAEVVNWLAARLGEPPPRFTGAPTGTRRSVTPDRVITNSKLKTLLGWRPRYPTFREGYESLLSR